MTQKQSATVRTGRIGEKGRLTLPAEIRSKYGLKEGDMVAFTETEDGILISPKVLIAQKLLDRMSEMFQDTTLEELMESSRSIRKELAKEMYGIDDADRTK